MRVTICCLLLAVSLAKAQPVPAPRDVISFDDDWRFEKGDPAELKSEFTYAQLKPWLMPSANAFRADPSEKAARPAGNLGGDLSFLQPQFDDSSWRQISLPQDWAIEGPFSLDAPNEEGKRHFWGPVWYRKHFALPASDQGRQIALSFDGAMSYATVWVNGQCAGGWPYGYASFCLDITPYVRPGQDNVVAVRLDSPPDSSRWYPGAGIDRNVWLIKTSPVHVAQWGVYVTTPQVSAASAAVDVRTSIENAGSDAAQVEVQTALYAQGAAGAMEAEPSAVSGWTPVTVAAGNNSSLETSLAIDQPKMWNLKTPNLYTAVTMIRQAGTIVDRQETTFGVRTIKFDPVAGFLLNGRHVPIQGVCMHSDLGALGTVVNRRGLQRQIEVLQEMGCNAIRTSHNPPSPELIDLCNRMGMLVMAESFDCWRWGKKANDYHLLFDDWSGPDLRALIRHYRNDPCVILWSIGNEVQEFGHPEALLIGRRLTGIVHEEDLTRPSTSACNVAEAGFDGFQHGVDVFGYNYKPSLYGKFRAAPGNESIPLFGSETASTVSSRGIYYFPLSKQTEPFQVTSYDSYVPPWATIPDVEWAGEKKNPFVMGEFVWTGFDYLGEPTPFNKDPTLLLNLKSGGDKAKLQSQMEALGKAASAARSSYFGIVDLAGFKKDRFYLYQSHWRPDFPMAHILPHWNWPDRVGQVTPVFVYTSGDEAELFLNGKSLGRQKKAPGTYRLKWNDVQYEPGELDVVAYKAGREWARDSVKTTSSASQLMLAPDRATLAADGKDLAYVTLRIADQAGLTVPVADNPVQFSVEGPGDLVAIDNGDASDLTSFQDPSHKAFNGLVMAIVRTRAGEPGIITLHAASPGLQATQATLNSR